MINKRIENTLTDISAIKGKTDPTIDTQNKANRKTREPIEKFTTDQLKRNSGIPEIIKRGRRLDYTDYGDIVLFFDCDESKTAYSDELLSMYRNWAEQVYGRYKFEDFLAKVDLLSILKNRPFPTPQKRKFKARCRITVMWKWKKKSLLLFLTLH